MARMKRVVTVTVLVWLFGYGAFAGELKLPWIFSEDMVLQRDTEVPVWGWGTKGADVRVRVLGRNVKVIADQKTKVKDDGTWRVTLPAMNAGGRYSFLAEMGDDKVLFSNVYVGEVWVTCGQSNMIWPIESTDSIAEARKNAHKYPLIRHFRVGNRKTHEVMKPAEEIQGFWGRPQWEEATFLINLSSRTDIPGCQGAVPYYFARELTKYLDGKVAVGMIDVGAILPVQTWVSEETVKATKALKPIAGKGYPNATSRGFMANIMPLAPYAIRGVLYYQGEMNAGNAEIYEAGLEAMIKDWRKIWQRPNLPFLFVQLPGYIKHQQKKHALDMDNKSLAVYSKQNTDHSWSLIRQAALEVWKRVPNTGMAVSIDLGEKWNIHPTHKREVAERLFMQALKIAYDKDDIDAFSPVPEKFETIANGVKITFKNTGKGLAFKPGKDKNSSFELQGADEKWQPATVEVKGNTLLVTAAGIGKVSAVRYAWRGFPEVTLYTKDGLPATPFRQGMPGANNGPPQ